jgi:hypothetical protein
MLLCPNDPMSVIVDPSLEGTPYLYMAELWTEASPPRRRVSEEELRLRRTPEGRAQLPVRFPEVYARTPERLDPRHSVPLTVAQLHDLLDDAYQRCKGGAHRVVLTLERTYVETPEEQAEVLATYPEEALRAAGCYSEEDIERARKYREAQ